MSAAAALFPKVEIGDGGHLGIIKLEAEHVEVLRDALRILGLREHDDAILQMPADNHLSGGNAVFFGRLGDFRLFEEVRLTLA